MSDKMREAFEAWAKATTKWDLYPFGTDQYADHTTNAAWFAWQAAQRGQTADELRSQRIGWAAAAAGVSRERAERVLVDGGAIPPAQHAVVRTAPVVPEELPASRSISLEDIGYTKGWNACRAAMLAAAPETHRG